MSEPACPACGEAEALAGRPIEGDIEITCQQCGAEWMRGEPHCKRCGRAGGVPAPQQMTRHPRGTLLSVVGVRHTLLCGDCDSEVVADVLERRKPVPEGYVSRFLGGQPQEPARQPTAKPAPTTPRKKAPPLARPVSPPTPAAPAAPEPLTDPTLRQAIDAFLNDGAGADSLTMVLLGSKLGASTRLSRLDTDGVAEELADWFDRTFTSGPDQRRQAGESIRRASAYWNERGWLTRDLAAGIE